MVDDPKDYSVGYGKPPKHSQFPKGRSGNPKGRPKGQLNLKTDLAAELNRRIDIREGERRRRVTKQEALIKRLVEKGLNGDQRAMTALFNLIVRAFGFEDPHAEGSALAADDQDILTAFLSQKSRSDAVASLGPDSDAENSGGVDVSDATGAEERPQDVDTSE